MDLEKNKQRLEILAAEVEELKNGGGSGGGGSDYELDLSPIYMGVALSNGVVIPQDKRYALEKHLPITFSSDDSPTKETFVFIGSRYNDLGPNYSFYFYVNSYVNSTSQGFKILQINQGTYKTIFFGASSLGYLNYISDGNIRTTMFDPTQWQNLYRNGTTSNDGIAATIPANGDFSGSGLGTTYGCGLYRASAAVAPTLLNCPTKEAFYLITDKYAEDGSNKYSQTIVENSGARIFKRGKDSNNNWTDWHLVGCDYFNPTDETLTNGGTISATALSNALKHVPLSFNAHVCYYSYEDTNNVYYTSTRLNGAALHTNVVAINKTTGVATFNEFDQS